MTVHVYSSFTFSYLNRARVLFETLKRHHPDWVLWAFVTDHAPSSFHFDPKAESFDKLVYVEELFGDETDQWLFGMDVVEACTAIKGKALTHIFETTGCEKVIYLDPDIAVFGSLQPISDLLEDNSIVLTPHQTDPESDNRAICDNEIASLQYGSFNLGFLAVKADSEGRRFANWWSDRLYDWCHDRLDIGVFVDQKWCNLVPCFFDNTKILRDPGYNVASWNISQRKLTIDQTGTILVNGHPLRFFHFTKLGVVGDTMTKRYAQGNVEVYEIWWWYTHRVTQLTDSSIPNGWWHFGTYSDGEKIQKESRVVYRNRKDVRDKFPTPFRSGSDSFQNWVRLELAS